MSRPMARLSWRRLSTCCARPRSSGGYGRRRARASTFPSAMSSRRSPTFEPLWDELFPAEQARIVRLLIERVDLAPDGMQVRLRAEGLQTLVAELRMRNAA